MAQLSSWFSILRWSLILALVLTMALSVAPWVFPRHFERDATTTDLQQISCIIVVGLSIFGLISICCYFFYFTLIFGVALTCYLVTAIVLNVGDIGHYLTLIGVIACSFTYCAMMRRLRNEALYGP